MTLCKRICALFLALTLLISLPFPAQAAQESNEELVRKLINYFEYYQGDAALDYALILAEMAKNDPALSATWQDILDFWLYLNEDMEVQPKVVPEDLPTDDSLCIVVMGYYLKPDGSMRDELYERLKVTLAFAEQYPNSYVLVTGGGTAAENNKVTEASEMAKYLIRKGIAKERVIVEDDAKSTIQNATYGCKILYRDYPQVKSMAVVTSDYHIYRSCLYMNTQAALDAYELGVEPIRVIANGTCRINPKASKDVPRQAEGVSMLADVDVEDMDKPSLSQLERISVSGKTFYREGEELELTVTAHYSTGYTRDVTANATYSGFDFGKSGSQTVTVNYVDNGTLYTAQLDIELQLPIPMVTQPVTEPPTEATEPEPVVEEETTVPFTGAIIAAVCLVVALFLLIILQKRRKSKRRRPRPEIHLE